MEARNLPSAGEIYKISEIKEMAAQEIDGKSVRVTGRLASRDLVQCLATLLDKRSGDQELTVETSLVEPFQGTTGSLLQFIGEMESRDAGVVLCARVVRNVEGLDLALYYQVVEQQRNYLSSMQHNSQHTSIDVNNTCTQISKEEI